MDIHLHVYEKHILVRKKPIDRGVRQFISIPNQSDAIVFFKQQILAPIPFCLYLT